MRKLKKEGESEILRCKNLSVHHLSQSMASVFLTILLCELSMFVFPLDGQRWSMEIHFDVLYI